MNLTRRRIIRLAGLAVAGLVSRRAAGLEANYPSRPIRVIVPFAAGGEADYLPRLVGQPFAETNKASFIIDNRAGGGATIGIDAGAKAAPDGYTLTIVAPSFTVNPSLMTTLPYNTLTDFAPITRLATSPHVLIVNPASAVKSVAGLHQFAKDRGNLSFASVGVGSINQLEGESLKRIWGIDLVHVPYRGTAPALNDMLGNNVAFMFVALPPLIPLLQSGQLKALAVSGRVRNPVIPDVPTMVESGYPDFVFESWYGLVAPRQTPSEYVAKLNSEMRRILDIPEISAKLRDLGFSPAGEPAAAFATFIADEVARYQKMISDIGIPRQ